MTRFVVMFLSVLLWGGVVPAVAENPPEPVTDKVLLEHLESVISWRREVTALDTVPGSSLENLLRTTLQKNSLKVLKYNFEFAETQAKNLQVPSTEGAASEDDVANRKQELKTTAQEIARSITQLNQRIADVNRQIYAAPTRLRPPLLLKRDKMNGEMKILLARAELLKSANNLFSNANTDELVVDLKGKIDNLSRTLPELQAKTKPVTDPASAQSIERVATTSEQGTDKAAVGILRLSDNIINLYRKKKDLGELLSRTQDLSDDNQEMIDYMRLSLRASVERGKALTNTEVDTHMTSDVLNKRVDEVIADFRQKGDALIPLGHSKRWLSESETTLQEWQSALDDQLNRNFRDLTVRLVILGIALMVPLAISEALRRTTKRYITDQRRQRQVNIVRRVVFSVVIGIIILLNIVTEFGSLATYIGLLTAGLAVALQNVILSMVSYFFYFGRFGVRIGDRVTIGNTTGEVVQIGIIRLYLMELSGSDSDWYPTGKIVSFPNSVLFQTSAFSKQVSGANYAWRKVSFVLDADTDYKLAHKKLMEAVQEIFHDYQDIMKAQQMALVRATHMNIKTPRPKGTIQFTDNGLVFVLRYPVEISRAAEINERVTKKIVETIDKEPSLRLVSATPPRIQVATEGNPA